jgi:hypothetical protein
MYQPYPGTTQMPDTPPRTIPGTVRQAVRAMYGGAAVSLIYLISSVATQGSTKTAIEKRFPHLTASQVTTEQHVLLIAGIVSGLVAIAAWILIARACQAGKNWARVTGTVLFGLATLDALGGLINPGGRSGQDPRVRDLAVRPYRGRGAVAGRLHRLLQGPPAMIEVHGGWMAGP